MKIINYRIKLGTYLTIAVLIVIAAMILNSYAAHAQIETEFEGTGCDVVELFETQSYLPVRRLLITEQALVGFEILDYDGETPDIEHWSKSEDGRTITSVAIDNSTGRIVYRIDINYIDETPWASHTAEVRHTSAQNIVYNHGFADTTNELGDTCRIISMHTTTAPEPETLEDLLGRDAVTALVDLSTISDDTDAILEILGIGGLIDTAIMISFLVVFGLIGANFYIEKSRTKDLDTELEETAANVFEITENFKIVMDNMVTQGAASISSFEKSADEICSHMLNSVKRMEETMSSAFFVEKQLQEKASIAAASAITTAATDMLSHHDALHTKKEKVDITPNNDDDAYAIAHTPIAPAATTTTTTKPTPTAEIAELTLQSKISSELSYAVLSAAEKTEVHDAYAKYKKDQQQQQQKSKKPKLFEMTPLSKNKLISPYTLLKDQFRKKNQKSESSEKGDELTKDYWITLFTSKDYIDSELRTFYEKNQKITADKSASEYMRNLATVKCNAIAVILQKGDRL